MKINKVIIYIVFFIILCIPNIIYASTKKEGIENFPASYQPYLIELQKKHPNWKFTALYTNLDWKYVIDNENIFGKNLVPKSYGDSCKNTKQGEYNVEVDAGWVDCSRQAVEYTMDPRNFLNEIRIFQFEALSYDEKTNNQEGIEELQRLVPEYATADVDTQIGYERPFHETSALVNEMIGLEYTVMNQTGLIRIEEKAGARKDRYTSVSYGNYFIELLEKDLFSDSSEYEYLTLVN